MFSSIFPSPRSTLSAHQALQLARVSLENARNVTDAEISMVLCHDTKESLSQAKKASKHAKDPTLNKEIGTTYLGLSQVLHVHDHHVKAQATLKKAQQLGYA